MQENAPIGWHSRGYLPHFDGGEICQFITFHLADALPKQVIERWKLELAGEKNEKAKIKLSRRIENYLDKGCGECHLKSEEIDAPVQESLLHFHLIRYKLIAWVIMPNHIHFLLKPINNHSLSVIIKKFKSFTAHEANKILGTTDNSGRKTILTAISAIRNIFKRPFLISKIIRQKQDFVKSPATGNSAAPIANSRSADGSSASSANGARKTVAAKSLKDNAGSVASLRWRTSRPRSRLMTFFVTRRLSKTVI